jgi:multidrug efflux pump subunit AcrB
MIFETSRQARFMITMARSLGFGILFATVITLILVPCLYLLIDDIHQWVGHGQPKEAALDAV